jgi:hypothetical protein
MRRIPNLNISGSNRLQAGSTQRPMLCPMRIHRGLGRRYAICVSVLLAAMGGGGESVLWVLC